MKTRSMSSGKKRLASSSNKKSKNKDSDEEDEAEFTTSEEEEEEEEEEDSSDEGYKHKDKKTKTKAKKNKNAATMIKLPSGGFNCSGELLWGHLQTLLEGAAAKNYDGIGGPISGGFGGGTILQHTFNYRCAARPGKWIVERAYIDEWNIGFVVHHVDVSGAELLKRAAKIGISNSNNHEDKNIVYVNRYDWSWHHNSDCDLEKTVYGDEHEDSSDRDNEDEDYLENLKGGRLMLIDPQHFDSFLNLLKKHPKLKNYDKAFKEGAGEPFGVHLSLEDTEYELGWLCYSGNKHATYNEADELVGIVYDGAYSALEIADGQTLKLEAQEIPFP